MIKKLLLSKCVVLSFLLGNTSFAQNKPLEVCGTEELQADFFKKNPGFKEIYEAKLLEFNEARKQGKFSKKQTEIIEIPIVVHILDDGKGLYVPTDAQVNAWIARANAIWDGSASDIKGPGAGGTTLPVRLVLAKRSPSCEATTGIIKHDLSQNQTYVDGGVANGGTNPGIPYATINSTYNWDSSSYFNIYITNKINGVNPSTPGINSYTAGFATYPGQSVDLSVMLYHVAIRANDTVLAHEMMHAFGVAHVFEGGDGEGKNCGSVKNDNISDTQNTRSGLFFGASINQNGQYNQYKVYPDNTVINDCANGALFDGVQYNMMNYGSRLDRFTPGQGQYAVDVINQMRPSFKTSRALQPIDTNAPVVSLINSCIPTASTTTQGNYGYGITRIQFGDIDVSSFPKDGLNNYYNDYSKSCILSNTLTEVVEGDTYDMKLTERTANASSFIAYLDLNNDGLFTDNEIILSRKDIPSENGVWIDKTHTFSVIIPNAPVKNTPLRLRIIGDAQNANFGACSIRTRGEIEDYAVIITAPSAAIWNGTTWSSEPTTTKDAIVRGDLSLTTNVSAKKLTVESGSVTVKTGSVLTVENEIVNNLTADKFIVEDGASVLQTSTAANVGNVTVLKNSTPMVFNDATLWSSPVDGQNVRSFSPATLDKRFYIYNEATNKFASLFVNDPLYPNSSLQNPNTYNFVAGLGYHIRVSNNQTQTEPGLSYAGKFIGKLNNGVITQPITKNGLGYNLLGNPYPSAIDAKKLIQANSSVQALHFWTHEAPLTSTGYASNNYASYNLTGGTQAAAGGVIPNNIINPGQGFIVETTASGSLTFDNLLRTGSLTGSFYKTSESDEKRIWIDLFEGATPKNQILIGYIENATNGFDNQMDATVNKLYTGSTLYSLIDNLNDHFVIQGRSLPFNQNDVVKLGFEVKEKATYTIKLNNVENLDKETTVFLKDKVDNQLVDLSKTDYSFDSEIGTYNDRFELVYTNKTLGTDDLKVQEISVYKQNGQLVVKSPKEIKNIEVYDISGRKIYTKSITGKEVVLAGLRSTNQVLVIKVTTADNKVNNAKILY